MAQSRVIFIANQAGISSMNYPGGHVHRMNDRMGKNTSRIARETVPVRSGEMRDKIEDPTHVSRPNGVDTYVFSQAKTTLFVHEGTRTPITRPGGGVMPIHNAHRTAVLMYRRRVRGQRANPFLARALRDAFRIEMRR